LSVIFLDRPQRAKRESRISVNTLAVTEPTGVTSGHLEWRNYHEELLVMWHLILDFPVDAWPPHHVTTQLFEPDYAQVALVVHSKDTHPKGTWDNSAEPTSDAGVIPTQQLILEEASSLSGTFAGQPCLSLPGARVGAVGVLAIARDSKTATTLSRHGVNCSRYCHEGIITLC